MNICWSGNLCSILELVSSRDWWVNWGSVHVCLYRFGDSCISQWQGNHLQKAEHWPPKDTRFYFPEWINVSWYRNWIFAGSIPSNSSQSVLRRLSRHTSHLQRNAVPLFIFSKLNIKSNVWCFERLANKDKHKLKSKA